MALPDNAERLDGAAADRSGPAATPARAALRYYGGKWRLARWIISHFPPHVCYCEPYGGAGSVLLRKPQARYEVWNDLEDSVVTFFRVLRERPDELIRAIGLTPFARAEVDLACAPFPPDLGAVERARRVYVRSWQRRHGLPAAGRMGWRFERATTRSQTAVDDWCATDHLWEVATRLKHVQIECDDALAVVRRFDGLDTLIYADPPYPASTRSKRWRTAAYTHELSDEDHRCLASVLRAVEGMAVISGAPCGLYDELYSDWQRVERRALTQSGALATECLWLSPRTLARLSVRQLALGERV